MSTRWNGEQNTRIEKSGLNKVMLIKESLFNATPTSKNDWPQSPKEEI